MLLLNIDEEQYLHALDVHVVYAVVILVFFKKTQLVQSCGFLKKVGKFSNIHECWIFLGWTCVTYRGNHLRNGLVTFLHLPTPWLLIRPFKIQFPIYNTLDAVLHSWTICIDLVSAYTVLLVPFISWSYAFLKCWDHNKVSLSILSSSKSWEHGSCPLVKANLWHCVWCLG